MSFCSSLSKLPPCRTARVRSRSRPRSAPRAPSSTAAQRCRHRLAWMPAISHEGVRHVARVAGPARRSGWRAGRPVLPPVVPAPAGGRPCNSRSEPPLEPLTVGVAQPHRLLQDRERLRASTQESVRMATIARARRPASSRSPAAWNSGAPCDTPPARPRGHSVTDRQVAGAMSGPPGRRASAPARAGRPLVARPSAPSPHRGARLRGRTASASACRSDGDGV